MNNLSKINLGPIRGFRDFYPEDWSFKNWLFEKARKVSAKYGYQEYEGPALENLALYEAKSGEELVKEQAYIFKDKKGQEIVLRPEMTPTLARMVAQKRQQLIFPLRWFSIGRRWRYEKQQAGRFREFWQWDVDLVGENSIEADAEIIAIACEFLRELGLTKKEVVIKVNNRRFLEGKLDLIEIGQKEKAAVIRLIDKKDKMSAGQWEEELGKIGLTSLQIKDLKGILKDRIFAGESDELTELFSTLKDLGAADLIEFDPTVVRGLDYYTGTVFEARDRQGKFRAIAGGGRYDNLVEAIGGEKLSGVGFAAGEAVIEEVLREVGKMPTLSPVLTKVLVTIFDEAGYRDSLKMAKRLRKNQIETEIYLSQVKLDKQLKYADRKGIPLSVILGPEERAGKMVTVKDLRTGEQKTFGQEKLVEEIRKMV